MEPAYVGGNPLLYSDPTGEYMCAAKPEQCKGFESARQATLKSSRASASLLKAASVFGDPGTANGITISFEDPGDGDAAATKSTISFQAVGEKKDQLSASAVSTVAVKPGLSAIELQAAVAHEGSHIVDAQAFASSFSNDRPDGDPSLNISRRLSEERAYKLTAEVANIAGKTFEYNGGTFTPNVPLAKVDQQVHLILQKLNPAELAQPLFREKP